MERDNRFDEMFEFDLNGIEVMYPHLVKPDTKYESVWKVDLILPEALAESMQKVGFNVREKDYGNGEVKIITAKRKTHKRDGSAMYPPRIYDAGTPESAPKPWPSDIAIGNGSIFNLKVSAKYVEVAGKTRLPLYLNSVQVVKHVPYSVSPFGAVDPETNSAF